MPTHDPTSPLEWNEENFEKVLSDLYQEIEADENLRRRLMDNPYEVLSSRIAVPEKFQGGILLAEAGRANMVLYVPPKSVGVREAMPEGTTEATSERSYQLICTIDPEW